MNKKRDLDIYNRKQAGLRIQKQREAVGFTLTELSYNTGLSVGYCNDIEHGRCGMSIQSMLVLANALHLSLDYLIHGDPISSYDTVKFLEHLSYQERLTLDRFCKSPKEDRDFLMECLQLYFQYQKKKDTAFPSSSL